MAEDEVSVTVRTGEYETTLRVERGRRLRDALLEAGVDVYGPVSRVANCGGRGLCGTCGVRFEGTDGNRDAVETAAPEPTHWHDRAAERFGYPRLSCQVTVEEPLTVRVPEKVMWGQLWPGGDD
jgi:Na+-transporting NADH:ubiquinone oxidoreductase subunit NqrF